jgi:hypothetical protein
MLVVLATWEVEIRRITVQAHSGIKGNSISKIIDAKRAGDVTQVVECLISKHEPLNSTLDMTKKEKEKKTHKI